MSETLRDLVVSLSLNTDNFTRNIKSVNKQIQEAESYFKLASAGVQDFDSSAAGLSAKLEMLERKLSLQKDAVVQYERALTAARDKLTECYTRQETYAEKLRLAKEKQEDLRFEVQTATAAYEYYRSTLGETDSVTIAAKQNMEDATRDLATQTAEVTKLSGQNDALKRSTQNAADAVSTANTQLNKAKAGVKETEAAIASTTAQLKTARSAWTALGKSLEEFGTKCHESGQKIEQVGKKLTAFITTPIAALGTTAVNASIEFESSFASVRKTVDATESEFEALSEASKRMSTEVAASTSTINEVIATGGQLGIQTEHLEEFARVMIDLGNSCEDLDANEAATSIAKFANVMGTDQSLFSNIGSTIVDLGNNFATTEKPIMEMAQRLAGAGRQVGLSESQILGFAAALSSVGIEAQMGGSSFSKALVKMEVAAETGGDALDNFARVSGMTSAEFKQLWDASPADAFMAFVTGLSQMDEAGMSAIAVLDEIGISEIRLRDTLLRTTNATELFQNAQDRANAAWNENTALSTEANKRYATTASQLTNLKNKAMLYAQTIGDDLSPMISSIIDSLNDFVSNLMKMDPAQRDLLVKLAAITAAVGPVLTAFGNIKKNFGTITGAIGKFSTAVGKAGDGFSGFMKTVFSAPSAWIILGAAISAGLIALTDYTSGAKRAREAINDMKTAAESWKDTQADTFYSSSKGLSAFGMSEDDFRTLSTGAESTVSDTVTWMDGFMKKWNDKMAESSKDVKDWTNSFKAMTGSTRSDLEELKKKSDAAGQTTLSSHIQTDMDTLDSIDKEVSALIKKTKDRYLTDKEKIRLQDLIDTRNAIEAKYRLSEADPDGFEKIGAKLQAEIARARAKGQDDADKSVYQDALVAAAEGMAVVQKTIDEQYDNEYALIQLIGDADEKQAALDALNQQYTEKRLEAAREYAAVIRKVIAPVFNDDGVQRSAEQVQELYDLLRKYSAADEDGKTALLPELSKLTKDLDESAMTEYVALLTQVQSLLDSGMTQDEIQSLFPELDVSGTLEQLAAIQTFLNDNSWDEALKPLQDMFGASLGEEVLRIATDLDMTGAEARWKEWAASPGSITTDAIVESYAAGEKAQLEEPVVQALISAYTEVKEGADKSSLTPEGLIAYVKSYAEMTSGADVSALTSENITAMVAAYQEMAQGADMSMLTPDEIVAYVTQYLEAQGIDTSALTPEGITAFVLAYEEVSGGAKKKLIGVSDLTAMIARYAEAEGVDLTGLSTEQIEATVTAFSEAVGCDKSELMQNFVAYITEYREAAGVSKPKLSLQIGLTGYDLLSYREWLRNNPVEVQGVVRLNEVVEDPKDVLEQSNVKFWKDGTEIPVTAVTEDMLTVSDVAVLDKDGTMHILLSTEITGTEEAVEKAREIVTETDQLAATNLGKSFVGLKSSTLLDYIDKTMKRIESYKDTSFWNFFRPDLFNLDRGIQDDFSPEKMAELSTYVGEVVKAIENGEEIGEEGIAHLQKILGFVDELDTLGIGQNVTNGIAEGMTEAGWDTSSDTLKDHLQQAINKALGISSPSTVMKPTGGYVSAGIAEGMTSYSMAESATLTADNLKTALSGVLTKSTLKQIGVNAMQGLANGITAGRADVIDAIRTAAKKAVDAAKDELKIESPSRVFRDEVGQMVMRGFGEGVIRETEQQANVIRNAARYLTAEAQGGVIPAGGTDNRKTYNQQSSVTLQVEHMQVRDETDIRALAAEIAGLTKSQQRAKGLRMA